MDIIKYLIAIFPSILLIFLGICIKHYKAYWLISGYNTMSAEKKKNVDIESLGKMMGNFCFVLAGFIFAFILLLSYQQVILSIIVFGMLIVTIICFLIKAQRFDSNAVKKDGTMKTGTKIMVGAVIAFLVLVSSGVGILLYQGNKPPVYNITEQKLEIKSLYGESIYFKDIVDVSISDELPKITARTNGSAIGSTLKGYFNAEQIGKVKLFVDTKTPPFIILKTDKQTIILNSADRTETQNLFTELKNKAE